jgi:hypothetical protein
MPWPFIELRALSCSEMWYEFWSNLATGYYIDDQPNHHNLRESHKGYLACASSRGITLMDVASLSQRMSDSFHRKCRHSRLLRSYRSACITRLCLRLTVVLIGNDGNRSNTEETKGPASSNHPAPTPSLSPSMPSSTWYWWLQV